MSSAEDEGFGARTTNVIEEFRRELDKRTAPAQGGSDVVSIGARLLQSILSERGLAALLLVGVLAYLFTEGSNRIGALTEQVSANQKSVNALLYQNEKVVDRVDAIIAEVREREQEERLRRLQQRFPYTPQERNE